jgi:hypothetical protein
MKRTLDRSEFFKGIVQTEHPDYDVRLPIFYYDNSAMSAIYTASTGQVRKHLPSSDMHPVEMFPGRCLLVFTAFEYRKTDIAPYNEFSISAIISYGRRAAPGLTSFLYMMNNCFTMYILHLPVTSERARRGGVEMAGYPKFIADISFAHEQGYTTCSVSENGQRILALTGKNINTSVGRMTKYVIYTMKQGIPLRANLYVNPVQYRQTLGRNAGRVEIGSDHAICKELHEMGLSRHPVLYQYMPSYEAILFGSRNLIDD